MARFSNKTIKKLKEAGWRPNRRTNISKVLEKANQENCYLTKEMKGFLSEFQGLSLVYSDGQELFDFEAYLFSITKERCLLLSSLIGEIVFNVGVMSNSNFLVVISETNKMYALTSGENDIFKLGDSFDEGIEFICHYGLKENFKYLEMKRIQ